MISKKWIFNKMVTNTDAAKTRHRRVCDHARFDWEKVGQDFAKFKPIRCHKQADRVFLLKVLALSQANIPTWAVWDALEAVKQIGPHTPLAYFRVVLRDDCGKAGVDLAKALRTVKVPANLPRYRTSKRRTTPISDDALKLRASELQEAIP
jgi:hypothetical protein